MSYVRRYSETISGSVSVSVDYPASENGGTTSGTAQWSEDVSIDILVDTAPFDASVGSCKYQVDLLTGAVVATEAAQLATKQQATKDISSAVIGGFFKLVDAELQQQMMELQALLPPKLQELTAQAARCRAMKTQMETDFGRIAERYQRLFDDLDQEASRRIEGLDKAAFALVRLASESAEQSRLKKATTVSAVTSAEKENTSAILLLSAVKTDAHRMIQSGQDRLSEDQHLAEGLQAILDREQPQDRTTHFVPIAYVEQEALDDRSTKRIFHFAGRNVFANEAAWKAIPQHDISWKPFVGEDKTRVENYLDDKLDQWLTNQSDEVSVRVATQMRWFWGQGGQS